MKKSERGAKNIREFNAHRISANIPKIKIALSKCKKFKMKFNSIGKLAGYIASETTIHRTTLLRNSEYRNLLHSYLVEFSGGLISIPDAEASPEILKAKLIAKSLEISNLGVKIKDLEESMKQLSCSHHSEFAPTKQGDDRNHYIAFVDTAMVLVALLERFSDIIKLDATKRTIEDLAARPSERVVIGEERTTAFLDWFAKNKDLLSKFKV